MGAFGAKEKVFKFEKMRTKRTLIGLGLIIGFILSFVGQVSIISASTDEIYLKDVDISDVGSELHLDFSNVTYTTDGTGTPCSGCSSLMSVGGGGFAGPDKDCIEPARIQKSEPVSFARRFGEGLLIPETLARSSNKGSTLLSFEANPAFRIYDTSRLMATNGTTSDEVFGTDEKAKYETGDHDFTADYDSATTWYDVNASAGANLFNVTADYKDLNASLTDATLIPYDEYFHNKDDSADTGVYTRTEKTSLVTGYEDTRVGIIGDLSAYLALINGVDVDKIVVTDYNLSSAKISYNISDAMRSFIKDVVDDSAGGGGGGGGDSALFGLNAIDPLSRIFAIFFPGIISTSAWSFPNPLKIVSSIAQKVTHSAISFGTKLKQFGTGMISGIIGTPGAIVKKTASVASKAVNTAGGFVKSALSRGSKLVVDTTVAIGKGVKNIGQKAIRIVTSVASGIFKIFTSPIMIILLLVFAIGAFMFLRKSEIL